MNKKTCSKCKVEKSFEDFYNNKNSKDKKYNICKSCVKKHGYNKRKNEIAKNGHILVEEKKCSICKKTKKSNNFYKDSSNKDCLCSHCKDCYKESYSKRKTKILKYQKKYATENKEKILKKRRAYRDKNREKIKKAQLKYKKKNKEKLKEYGKKRRANPEYKKKAKIYMKEYYQKNKNELEKKNKKYYQANKGKFIKLQSEKRKKDPQLRLNHNISNQIQQSLKGKKAGKKWQNLVGYTLNDLKTHLESLWEPWMSWDNYGNPNGDHSDCWHIDHIIPKSWFKYTSPEDEQFKKCWALSNLQPKEGKSNISKNNKFIG